MLKKIICAALSVMVLCQLPSEAAVIQNTETGIAVTEYGMQPRAEYPIIIVKPGKVIEDLSNGDDADIIAYSGTVFSDDEGAYALDITLDDCIPGLYTVYGGKDSEKSFWFAAKKEKDQALNIFTGDDETAIFTYLSDKNKIYAVLGQEVPAYTDYYEKLTEDGKKKVVEDLIGFKVNGSVSTISDIDKALSDFSDKFLEINKKVFADYGFAGIKSSLTIDNVVDVLTAYNDIFGIDMERVGEGQAYNTSLYNALSTKTNLTKDELGRICYEQNAVCQINALNKFNAGSFLDIVEANADVFGTMLEETGFSAVSDQSMKENILIKVVEKSDYTDAAEVKTYLAGAVQNPGAVPTKQPSSGGSGGGGGGGSSSGSSGGVSFVQMNPGVIKNTETPVTPDAAVEPDETGNSFDDMADYEWAAEAVEGLYKKGYVDGVSDTEFEPGRSISREEYLAMMLRAFGIDSTDGEPQFEDVDRDAWYAPYVTAAYDIGIINGISNTEFGVGKPIIRQDAAVILNNLIKYSENEISAENEYSITDKDDISDYASEAVESLVRRGIISGDEEQRFLPKKSLSRAEAAVMLYRYVRGNE